MIKTKSQECWWKLGRNLFALPPPPILNRVQNELTHSHPVKTIKKEKYIIHCSTACSVEVTCIVTIIILENMFWHIKSAFFSLWGNRGRGNLLLSLHVCKCSISATGRYVFISLLFFSIWVFFHNHSWLTGLQGKGKGIFTELRH